MFTQRISSVKVLFCLLGLLCLTLPSAQASETILHSFSNHYLTGQYPIGQLAVYNSQFYGVTAEGINGYGNIFRMSPAGVITNLHEFNGADGAYPYAGMIQINGTLYGTCSRGGVGWNGVLFKIATNGRGFSVLHYFLGYNPNNPAASDGKDVDAGLTLGSDGKLYGVTIDGGVYSTIGSYGDGTVFSFDPSTNTYTLLHSFNNNTDGGRTPSYALAEGPDGALYGTIYHLNASGSFDSSSLFKINKDGTGYTLVHTFPADGSDPAGNEPNSDLIQASDGNLYGTCYQGGLSDLGTVYKLVPSTGSVTALWSFDGPTGAYSGNQIPGQSRLLQGADGNLYGVTPFGGSHGYGTAFKLTLSGVCSVLTNFDYGNADGAANPLIQYGTSFYCTSNYGGEFADPSDPYSGYGAAISLSATGTLKVLQSFGQIDGAYPSGPLVQIPGFTTVSSRFYGACSGGGEYGDGILYVTGEKSGYTILHHLNDSLHEGNGPVGGLVLARDGKLYGMCASGGLYGYGTLFQVTTRGVYKVIHHFTASEGEYPTCALAQGPSGDDNLYGTLMGGAVNTNGILFKTDTAGANFQILHVFTGSEGAQPECTPLAFSNGYLAGTCSSGGGYGGGTVWFCSTDGSNFGDYVSLGGNEGDIPYYAGQLDFVSFSALNQYLEGTGFAGGAYNQGAIYAVNVNTLNKSSAHAFNDAVGEGSGPIGGFIFDWASGNDYGCCLNGGAHGKGTLYALHRSTGVLTVLQAFGAGADGATPLSSPILGADGNLYGVTGYGGQYGYGVIYRHTPTP